MPDDVDELRELVLTLREDIEVLEARIDSLEKSYQ